MNGYALAADLLPEDYRRALPPACLEAEEIRLRVGRSPTLLRDGREQSFFERSCQEKSGRPYRHVLIDNIRDDGVCICKLLLAYQRQSQGTGKVHAYHEDADDSRPVYHGSVH